MRMPYPSAGEAYKAAQLLGLELNGLELAAVSSMYRTASKSCHPDSSTPDSERFTRVKWARDLLERWLQGPVAKPAPIAKGCASCEGKGYIKRRSGLKQTCVMCNGKG